MDKRIIDALLAAAEALQKTDIPAPEGAPPPKVYKKPKKTGPGEFTAETASGKKLTLLAEINRLLGAVTAHSR